MMDIRPCWNYYHDPGTMPGVVVNNHHVGFRYVMEAQASYNARLYQMHSAINRLFLNPLATTLTLLPSRKLTSKSHGL